MLSALDLTHERYRLRSCAEGMCAHDNIRQWRRSTKGVIMFSSMHENQIQI
jgi:hypothetical protein